MTDSFHALAYPHGAASGTAPQFRFQGWEQALPKGASQAVSAVVQARPAKELHIGAIGC
ncbi:MAG: hypothetical protein KDA61_01180 [Planctomycetales bacterium]|nr:hypothetical protein [Planctomycetales bacterium]